MPAFEPGYSQRHGVAYVRKAVIYNCPIKIYTYIHMLTLLSDLSYIITIATFFNCVGAFSFHDYR